MGACSQNQIDLLVQKGNLALIWNDARLIIAKAKYSLQGYPQQHLFAQRRVMN
jgi:hypothetical protein